MSTNSSRPELAALMLSDPPERWQSLGFEVCDGRMWIGTVRIELGAPGHGIVGWSLRGVPHEVADIDGLPLGTVAPTPGAVHRDAHPNGAIGLDHVVVFTPDFDRSATSLARVGAGLRRVRHAPGGFRQGFRRLGPVILELVEAPMANAGPARFWGLVMLVADLEQLAARLGDALGPVKPAVQPGRRIATLRESAGLDEAVAFMEPERRT